MSRIREHACADPGPYDYHCTEDPGHRYSCYDAGEDSSWNDRDNDIPHECQDPQCSANLNPPKKA